MILLYVVFAVMMVTVTETLFLTGTHYYPVEMQVTISSMHKKVDHFKAGFVPVTKLTDISSFLFPGENLSSVIILVFIVLQII